MPLSTRFRKLVAEFISYSTSGNEAQVTQNRIQLQAPSSKYCRYYHGVTARKRANPASAAVLFYTGDFLWSHPEVPRFH
jgi:hypothetical protein